MFRKNRIHEKDIQVRSMVCNDNVWAFRNWRMDDFFNPIKTKEPHHPTPKNEEVKTKFLPMWTKKNGKEERIK